MIGWFYTRKRFWGIHTPRGQIEGGWFVNDYEVRGLGLRGLPKLPHMYSRGIWMPLLKLTNH